MVAPRPRTVMSTALIGSTSDPNVRNISIVTMNTTSTAISGSLSMSALIESCSIAGVPPIMTVAPSGTSMLRRKSMAGFESLRSVNPALKTMTPSLLAPTGVNFSINPGALFACVVIAPSVGPCAPSMTILMGSVRWPGNRLSNSPCATRVTLSGGR